MTLPRDTRHNGRLLTHKGLALKFCNVIMEQVIAYIDIR